METQPVYKRTHPMVPIAAASVVVMSLVGIGVFTGIIPNRMSSQAEQPVEVASNHLTAPAPTVPLASTPVPARNPAPPPVPREPYYTPQQPAVAPPPQVAAAECLACGRVEAVQTVTADGKGSGVGAVAGGVGGALLGNQVGNGNGRTAMTVLGAAGGAFAGHTIEKKIKKTTSYRVQVRMDDGSTRSFNAGSATAYNVGERVRVENGALVRVG